MRVYLVNDSGHDYSPAKRWGKLVRLTVGKVAPSDTNEALRNISHVLRDSHPDDWIIISGPSTYSSIACAVFAYMHGRLNILVFTRGMYVERKMVFESLVEREKLESH